MTRGGGEGRRTRSKGSRSYQTGTAGYAAEKLTSKPPRALLDLRVDSACDAPVPPRDTRHQALKCEASGKMGHVPQVCWSTYPHLRPSRRHWLEPRALYPEGLGGTPPEDAAREPDGGSADGGSSMGGGGGRVRRPLGHAPGGRGASARARKTVCSIALHALTGIGNT